MPEDELRGKSGSEPRSGFDLRWFKFNHFLYGIGERAQYDTAAIRIDFHDDDACILRVLYFRQSEFAAQIDDGDPLSTKVYDSFHINSGFRYFCDPRKFQDFSYLEHAESVLFLIAE